MITGLLNIESYVIELFLHIFHQDLEKQQEVEAKKPEFMRVNLKKASKEVEAS